MPLYITAPLHKRRKSGRKRSDVQRSQTCDVSFHKATRVLKSKAVSARVVGPVESMPDISREMSDSHCGKLQPVKYKLSLTVTRQDFSRNSALRSWLLINGRKLKGRPLDSLGRECYVFSLATAEGCPVKGVIQSRVPMSSTSNHDTLRPARHVNTGSKPSRMRNTTGMPNPEEIDRAEAESCGVRPIKRGMESDSAFQRRSEMHERARYGRSSFD